MKNFIFIASIFILSVALIIVSRLGNFDKKTYLPKKTLDMATPINVTIKLDLFKEASPAYDIK